MALEIKYIAWQNAMLNFSITGKNIKVWKKLNLDTR